MQLTELHNLPHCLCEEKQFVHLHTDEGWFITEPKQNPIDFYASNCFYLPYKENYPNYEIINLADKEKAEKARLEAIKLKQNELRKL